MLGDCDFTGHCWRCPNARSAAPPGIDRGVLEEPGSQSCVWREVGLLISEHVRNVIIRRTGTRTDRSRAFSPQLCGVVLASLRVMQSFLTVPSKVQYLALRRISNIPRRIVDRCDCLEPGGRSSRRDARQYCRSWQLYSSGVTWAVLNAWFSRAHAFLIVVALLPIHYLVCFSWSLRAQLSVESRS